MPRRSPADDKTKYEAYQLYLELDKNQSETARRLGISRQTFLGWIEWVEMQKGSELGIDPESVHTECHADLGADTGTVITRSPHIQTPEDALDYAKIDRAVWEKEKVWLNSWEVARRKEMADLKFVGGKRSGIIQDTGEFHKQTMWQVKVLLRRRFIPPVERALKVLNERLATTKLRVPAPRTRKLVDPHLLLMALYDAHFGLLAWEPETDNDQNLRSIERIYEQSFLNLLAKTRGYPVEQVLLPVGQDFFHINAPDNQTPATKNALDVDSRLAKIFDVGFMACVRVIAAASRLAPVRVIWVPGNHDPETSFYLVYALSAWFRNVKGVQVDLSPKARKYEQYGATLLGFSHGNEEPHRDLPTIMAAEEPEAWAATSFREWLLGHIHKKKQTHYLAGDTHGGVLVRTVPSLCATDYWHYRRGYVGKKRAAEAYLYSKEHGPVGNFICNLSEL